MQIAYRSILLPIDGSPLAAQAIPHAQHLAALFQAELTVLRAVEDPAQLTRYQVLEEVVDQGLNDSQNLLEHWLREADAEMSRLCRTLGESGLKITPVVEVGNPAAVILDYANNTYVDLIVIATHGRGGVARWVYGSVAEKVIQGAACPVCIVRVVADEVAASPAEKESRL